MSLTLTPIAYIHNDFPDKFGIPRQSGLSHALKATIVFEPDYRHPEAFRGLLDYSHLWLIWGFSKNTKKDWSPTVRPPRLGGNKRMGVFATRSPFRPNPLGLSSVCLESIEMTKHSGPILHISGADLMDGTPIYDIKPYLAYADSHPDASNGFAQAVMADALTVKYAPDLLHVLPAEKRQGLIDILRQDPRPSYQTDASRIYGLRYAAHEIRFKVEQNVLTILSIEKDINT